ncbi:DUF4422 domain-containing protein [Terrisporobacter petrolearius]|uniref:DUF4422 domain-containing protein n=1 Tax=Terrisporobacter petrolearius TaxID=1460447 RepID=UPI003B002D8C
MEMKMLVATHKKYKMPSYDIYLPIHVGREGKQDLGYQGDNQGENISSKNSNYCELTGLYWAWKNLNCEVIGLSHYRRHFTVKSKREMKKNKDNKMALAITDKEIAELLNKCDVIVPKKRNYYVETIWSHYEHAHNIKDLIETKNIMEEKYPEYIESFNEVMNGKTLYLYNMFIMNKKDFNSYCEWLFNILFELESRTDLSEYNTYQSRIYGFISERLFNVWLMKNSKKIEEIDVVNIEEINWAKKIYDFFKRKFRR